MKSITLKSGLFAAALCVLPVCADAQNYQRYTSQQGYSAPSQFTYRAQPIPQAQQQAPKKRGLFSRIFGGNNSSSSSSAGRASVQRRTTVATTGRYAPRSAQPAAQPQQQQRRGFFARVTRSAPAPQPAPAPAPKPQVTSPPKPTVPSIVVNYSRLHSANAQNTRLIVEIGRQKAHLLVDGNVALTTPISSGRAGKPSPRGEYKMTERIRDGKISTLYDVEMPYWMRLGWSEYGVHAGYLPGYPASAGCVRLPSNAAQMIYDATGSGTPVSMVEYWHSGNSYASR